MKVLTKLRLIIFYLINGEYDVIYASLPDVDCHWLKAYYARSHSGVHLDSYLELVIKKPRDKSMAEFIPAVRDMLICYGCGAMQADIIMTQSKQTNKHKEYMQKLFPMSQPSLMEYRDVPKRINTVNLRYIDGGLVN